jgi:hypothetical protein
VIPRDEAPKKTPFENKTAKKKSQSLMLMGRGALFPQISRCEVDFYFLGFGKEIFLRASREIREESMFAAIGWMVFLNLGSIPPTSGRDRRVLATGVAPSSGLVPYK